MGPSAVSAPADGANDPSRGQHGTPGRSGSLRNGSADCPVRSASAWRSRRAHQVALAQSYDNFYGGAPAPLSEVTAALSGKDGYRTDNASRAQNRRPAAGRRLSRLGEHPAAAVTTNALRARPSSITVVLAGLCCAFPVGGAHRQTQSNAC